MRRVYVETASPLALEEACCVLQGKPCVPVLTSKSETMPLPSCCPAREDVREVLTSMKTS